ncbi:MAG: FxsA family protein [Pseudomonadota bacterium]
MLVFFALLLIPLAEIALFVVLGGEIGLPATLAVVLLTAVIGTFTLRSQGLQTLQRLRQIRADQEAPIVLIEGLLIAAAGLLLLTPGFLTDAIGFSLLVPPLRRALAKRAAARAVVFAAHNMEARMAGGAPRPNAEPQAEQNSGSEPKSGHRPAADQDGRGRSPFPRRKRETFRRRSAEDAQIIDEDGGSQD